MLIRGTVYIASLRTNSEEEEMIDESEWVKGVRRREKEESILERAKAVVESLRLALDPHHLLRRQLRNS